MQARFIRGLVPDLGLPHLVQRANEEGGGPAPGDTPRIEMDGEAYLVAIARRRRELGVTDEDDAKARNPRDRRTPGKRELLRRIGERARAAELEPLPAKF